MNAQEEVSIKVHCIVSCFCEVVKRHSSADYRPFYFGVWDAQFDVTDQGGITYYQHDLNHNYFMYWFEQLYGPKVHEWYDPRKDKETNLAVFLDLLERSPEHRRLIVQIDMSCMPERENNFHQKPFPHFLLISKTANEDEWYMCDPDFRWEGVVSKERVIEAIVQNPFGGGFYIDAERITPPSPEAFERFFQASFSKNYNELTLKLKELIARMAAEEEGYTFSMLTEAVKQLPVIAIRKYSYEHALMYLMEQTEYDEARFEYWTDRVEEIVQGLNNVQYKTMKMTMTGSKRLLPSILQTLEHLDAVELGIKRELERLFALWKAAAFREGIHA